MASIDDVSSVVDDFIILSFIIQLSSGDFSKEQRMKIRSKIQELTMIFEESE